MTRFINLENRLEEYDEEGTNDIENRTKVIVEFFVIAPSTDDAEYFVNSIIREGILATSSCKDNEDEQTEYIDGYDIIDSEPIEV